jgi:hypothetical protein
MDHDGENDSSAIWSSAPPTERAKTRPPKDPLLTVTKLTANSIDDFETALRSYLDNGHAESEHSQCEIEVWGGVTLYVCILSRACAIALSPPLVLPFIR